MLKNKKASCEQLFCLGYFLFAAYSYLVHIDVFTQLMKIGVVVAIIFLLLCFVMSGPFTKKEIVSLIIFIGFMSLITATSRDLGLVKLMILLLGMKHVDLKKIITLDYKIRIIFIAFVFILCIVGIAPDQIVMRDNIVRHSLGFANPNILGIVLSIYLFEFLYLQNLKLTIWTVFWFLSVVGFIYYITDSRSAILINLVLILLSWIYNFKPLLYKKTLTKKIFIYSFLIFALCTFLAFNLYKLGDNFAIILNKLLSNRVERIYIFEKAFGFSLLGQNISSLDMSLDNLYAYIFFSFGFIAFLVCLILSVSLMKKLYALDDIPLIIMWVVFFLYGLSERIFILAEYNVFMLTFSYLLYSNKEGKGVERKYVDSRL